MVGSFYDSAPATEQQRIWRESAPMGRIFEQPEPIVLGPLLCDALDFNAAELPSDLTFWRSAIEDLALRLHEGLKVTPRAAAKIMCAYNIHVRFKDLPTPQWSIADSPTEVELTQHLSDFLHHKQRQRLHHAIGGELNHSERIERRM
ncbi:TPA: hypothetical protein ACG4ML_000363 [Stenotrophomonas maltophilia]|uniref:hypothetical protein n=1 Tax=Pseudomonadota TaxID=1224 RepID=UPI000B4C898F|nr:MULTISPECIES: hypothetical protein [Pseudomonadota]OWQ71337.1 hypothetical protein CEE57_10625 [Stenotrophomonas maltophilia]PZU05781.1 MAG: hypothetical protein DI605_21030 [Sphingomonas sp.]HDS1366979.1 hypothetical protein [Stenotrophomonas maltophilia]HDS1371783.1 hypothetical protein [Stenotrophomonas maltophilia]HDS1376379.1 hypothetical protein [Stenotrophomonas maltophilia]